MNHPGQGEVGLITEVMEELRRKKQMSKSDLRTFQRC